MFIKENLKFENNSVNNNHLLHNNFDEKVTAMPERKTYSVKEAANILGVAQTMIYKMVSNQSIPYVKFGKRVVIPIEQFNKWFEISIRGGELLCAAQ